MNKANAGFDVDIAVAVTIHTRPHSQRDGSGLVAVVGIRLDQLVNVAFCFEQRVHEAKHSPTLSSSWLIMIDMHAAAAARVAGAVP